MITQSDLNDDRGRMVDDREEGGGERDQPFYDKSLLQKPIVIAEGTPARQPQQPEIPRGKTYRPTSPGDNGNHFILNLNLNQSIGR